MPYGEIETTSLGHGKELTNEPCYKKLKSTEEAYVFSHHGRANFHRIQEKTGNDWVAATVIDLKGNGPPQEDKTKTVLLKPSRSVMPGNRPDVVESTDSQVLQDPSPPAVSSDDGIYSTSKAFIGPIYKPPEKKKYNERRKRADTISGINGKGERDERLKVNSKKSEIDNELSQFYKEIEALENEKDDLEGSCKEPELSEEQPTPYYPDHHNDLVKSDEEKKRDLSNVLQSHCSYQQYLGSEPGKYPCNGQVVVPPFCDISFTSFRPEWQSVHSFIVPHGPPGLPSFNYHLNIQRFHPPPNPTQNIFCAQDNSQVLSGYSVDGCHINWNCLTSDQNNKYTDCTQNNSSVHPSRNSYSVQDGHVSNGFCETRGGWKDPFGDKLNGTERFMSRQFQEEKLNKLQKLLILLRGLPGSGKTTLSRILLAQSRDGIVFSTDDYFHHQDGYRYNVTQLGDAHDWNQNRAKQAIDQGRSPVIIDNTNTQAWEMKPYVEMAIGKGYRVEFHEPETWWKFDPEELEKRNKHGVSRQKIAQMLDRYEYQMSISIVMNSVEPPHKGTQRPPPPQWRQRERNLKRTGFRLSTTKQKRNRKRNKKQTSPSKLMGKSRLNTVSYLPPGGQSPSQSEEEDLEETKRESTCTFTGGLEFKLRDFVSGFKEERWRNINPEESFPDAMSVVELDNTPKNCLPQEGDHLFLSSWIPHESSVTCQTVTQNLFCVTSDGCSVRKGETHAENRQAVALDCQDRFDEAPCSFMQGTEMGDRSLLGETILCCHYGSTTSDKISREGQGVNATKTNYWAFFSINLSNEDLQLNSGRQHHFGSWSERPYKFICEQRPKKDKWPRLACLNKRGGLLELISTSEGASVPESCPEILMEEKRLIEDENLLSPTENIDSFIETETDIVSSCSPKLDIPKDALLSTGSKKRRQRRIVNLAPNFDLPRRTNITAKGMEKDVLLTESHALKIILGEEKRISMINNEEENKQKLKAFSHHPTWLCLDIIKDTPLNIGGQFYSHCFSFNRLRSSMYFYNNVIPSLMLQYSPSFWKIPFASKEPSLTFKSDTKIDKKLNDVGFISSEILSSQPYTLYSFKMTSHRHYLNERFGEKLKTWEEPKPLQCLQTENQNLTSTNFCSLGLPLSQGFAFQLVRLFGSPGVPMESLLPDDYVVPLDWKTLKLIYLQWKTSVEPSLLSCEDRRTATEQVPACLPEKHLVVSVVF
ncbi:uncharacterized protein LOC143681722 isoform X2 [Tamandua tetradactyla]|uniref:uncharacterized protein LOC143681722 isoform X2 n=1 Tax=Tamandua tetradactyla TaxID=48850 RepID=UPI00405385D2